MPRKAASHKHDEWLQSDAAFLDGNMFLLVPFIQLIKLQLKEPVESDVQEFFDPLAVKELRSMLPPSPPQRSMLT